MKPSALAPLIGVVAGCGLALAACILDLSNLSGGTRDGGADGGGEGGSTMTSTTGSVTGSTGSTGSACTGAVLHCSGCPCPAGGCGAVPLATGADAGGPRGVAASSDGVFWADKVDGRIMGILAQGSGPQVLTKAMSPTALAAAAGRLVFTAQDGLWTCLLPSCETTKSKLAGSIAPGSIQSVAYDGQLVYWADRGGNGDGQVWRCDLASSCASPGMIAGQQLNPQGLFLTTDSVFWIVQGNGQSNGSVHKSPRAGAGQTDIAASLVLPTGLAADETYVYWTEGTMNGTVLRCDYTLGYCMNPTSVTPTPGTLGLPLDLAIAGGRIYWNESSKGTISSCPLPGCGGTEAPRVHASGRQGVHRIAVGSSCLFWTDDVNGGTVDKVGR